MPILRRVGAAPPCEPCVQDEDDPSGLAAPRRVAILEIGDADTEACQAAVEYLDALAWRGRCKCLQKTVGDQFAVSHLCRDRWLALGYGWATNPPRTEANV